MLNEAPVEAVPMLEILVVKKVKGVPTKAVAGVGAPAVRSGAEAAETTTV